MRKPIPVDQSVGITLWYLATCVEYRSIGHLFGVVESTVCTIVKEVCHAISSHLSKIFIKFPIGNSLQEVVDGYRTKFGFPNCIGAVDGCHIPIIAPREDYQDYYNRKGWYSIILQGTVIINIVSVMFMLAGLAKSMMLEYLESLIV